MTTTRLSIAFLILSTGSAMAADSDDFEAREHRDADGNAIVYRIFKPRNYDPAKKYPLVLFLHGAGERGTNNISQVRDARYFAKEQVQKDNPAFVVAPQCPMNRLAFQLYGEKKDYNQTYNDYGPSAGQWKKYTIELAKLTTGAKTHLLVVNSDLARPAKPRTTKPGEAAAPNPPPPPPAVMEIRNLAIYESTERGLVSPIDLRKLNFDKRQGGGRIEVSEDGTTLSLKGGVQAKAPLEKNVTAKTVMTFEFRSTAQGAAHAIGLDIDEQFDYRWVQRDWSGKTHTMPREPSIPMKLVLESLENLKKEFSIDPQRLYVTGLSMGGYGTWDLIARHPKMFAAAIPVCGGADETTAQIVKDIPIWCFHGGADTVVKTERSRNMIEAIKKAGGTPKYTEYPGVGHNSWDRAYSDLEMMKWMFAQKRN